MTRTQRDLTGRVVVITGASSGIGAAAAAVFAAQGARVGVVGRNPERTEAVAASIGADPFVADFSRLDDVRTLAAQLGEHYPRIDVLANNAGGAWSRRTTTVDGNEQTFQVNHLAPFLLTMLLLPRLMAALRPRVINTGSMTYRWARLRPSSVNAATGRYSLFGAYASSKLATVLFTRELARRTIDSSLTTAAFHPGAVATHVYDDFPLGFGKLISSPLSRPVFMTPAAGAGPLVHLVTTPDTAAIDGRYFHRFTPENPRNPQALDPALGEWLWTTSERITGVP
ncbi:SDR family NAD(P)-dependent oxidoreductase [Nocardia sp. NPDC050793]|uniref:SDR family NAD(P)-dependent oxidoreductase n=1 Tax=Nocardia sp. NPDC050793 TaxID=3155159 RepID=UPI0033E18AF6